MANEETGIEGRDVPKHVQHHKHIWIGATKNPFNANHKQSEAHQGGGYCTPRGCTHRKRTSAQAQGAYSCHGPGTVMKGRVTASAFADCKDDPMCGNDVA